LERNGVLDDEKIGLPLSGRRRESRELAGGVLTSAISVLEEELMPQNVK